MSDFIVQLKGKEYRINTNTRNKAIGESIRLFKKETNNHEYFMVLFSEASCTKIGGRKRGGEVS